MKKYLKYLFAIMAISFWSCSEEFELEEAPQPEAAAYEIEESTKGDNYLVFTNTASGFIKKWDFGNGATAEGDQVEGYFPFAGSYEVTLTLFTAGGSVSSSETINIEETDPTICQVEFLDLLTGGCDQPDGKTWVIDADRPGHFGVGPLNAAGPDYYAAAANEKEGGGMYDDEYTFILNQYQYIQQTNGDVYVNPGQGSNFPGASESPVGDLIAPYDASENINFSFSPDSEGNTVLKFNNNGFIGYNTGVNTYTVLSISENEMLIRFNDASTPDLSWFHRLIRKGYAPVNASFTATTDELTANFTNTSLNATSYSWDFGDGSTSTEENPTHTYAVAGTYTVTLNASATGESDSFVTEVTVSSKPTLLPLDFESFEPVWSTFGGNIYSYIDNPDPSGNNVSARVMEVVHGAESWAGQFVDLNEPLDFSQTTELAIDVWAPSTGQFRLKLENIEDNTDFIEVDANIPVANEWVTLTFDVSAAVGKSYARVVIFPGWNVASAGTFYVDNIQYAIEAANELTLELLTGGGEKSWILKPDASAFGVGPAKGDVQYFSAGPNDRPCLFNDEFIFKNGGQYEYNANGDIYAEPYMAGLAAGCTAETALDGTDAAAWGSGTHSFSLTTATETEPAFITVRGTGAFIALPKAFNGGEYTSAPPDMDATVSYEVLDYTKDASGETLSLTIDVSGDGSVYWNFILIPNQ